MNDINAAIANLTRSSTYALTAAKDGNLDSATREDILRGAIESNAAMPDHMAEYTRRLHAELTALVG